VRRALRLLREHHTLRDSEAVLLVDHGKAEAAISHRLLEDGVCPDEDVDRAIRKAHQGRLARAALVSSGENCDVDRQARELARQGLVMLAREDLGRREQRPCAPASTAVEHRHQRDQGLAEPTSPGAGEASAPPAGGPPLSPDAALAARGRIRELQPAAAPSPFSGCPALRGTRRAPASSELVAKTSS
jgi:hypothetical protein